MSTLDELLGSAPPHSWDALRGSLLRLRRHYQTNADTPRSFHSNRLDEARCDVIEALLRLIEPAVRDEAAAWDAADRVDAQAKAQLHESAWD